MAENEKLLGSSLLKAVVQWTRSYDIIQLCRYTLSLLRACGRAPISAAKTEPRATSSLGCTGGAAPA